MVNEQAKSTSGVSTLHLLLARRAKPWPFDIRSVFNAHRLKEHLKALPVEDEAVSLPNKVKAIGQIECLSLTVGAVPVECTALIVGEFITLWSSTVGWVYFLLPQQEKQSFRKILKLKQSKFLFGPPEESG